MKYIRTKHGTIEINDPAIEREIVAQADTIWELCDRIVILKDGEPVVEWPCDAFYVKQLKSIFLSYDKMLGIWTE